MINKEYKEKSVQTYEEAHEEATEYKLELSKDIPFQVFELIDMVIGMGKDINEQKRDD